LVRSVREQNVDSLLLYMLMILLHDRCVQKVEVHPRVSKLAKLGIGKKRRDPAPVDTTREIALYVPRRIHTANHGGTHASPRMHFRAAHTRKQPYGPKDNPSYKDIRIESTW
jgi:hypothetical protein